MPQHPPRHADPSAGLHANQHEESSDEEEEVNPIEIMNSMSVDQRRKTYAIKGLFNKYKSERNKLREEIAKIQREHHEAAQKLHEIRREIVNGVRDITEEEIAAIPKQEQPADADANANKKGVEVLSPEDEAQRAALKEAAANPNGGIPGFWLNALRNTEVMDGMIMEHDVNALSHLTNITSTFIDNDPYKGVVLSFSFSPNTYFSNETLTKTYHMEFVEEWWRTGVVELTGCIIGWHHRNNNLTLPQKRLWATTERQARAKGRSGAVYPRPSFFHFFNPLTDGVMRDEKRYGRVIEMDLCAGKSLMEEIVPKAAFYYSGKNVELVARELMSSIRDGEDVGHDKGYRRGRRRRVRRQEQKKDDDVVMAEEVECTPQ